jgi:hypothetical protein
MDRSQARTARGGQTMTDILPPEQSQRAYAAWRMLQNGLPESAEDELAAMHGMMNYRIRHKGRLLCKLTLPIDMSDEDWTSALAQITVILGQQVVPPLNEANP